MPGRHPRDGRALEILGHFNPSANPPTFSLNKGRLEYWLSQGAQMTEAVKKLAEGKYEFRPYQPKPPETTEEVKETKTIEAAEEETPKPKEKKEGKAEESKEAAKGNERTA